MSAHSEAATFYGCKGTEGKCSNLAELRAAASTGSSALLLEVGMNPKSQKDEAVMRHVSANICSGCVAVDTCVLSPDFKDSSRQYEILDSAVNGDL